MAVAAMANDASFYMSGNTLVPIKETDISVAKEILTITIGKDRYAKVDVYYEFYNPGKAKTLTMAFEADPPSYLGGLQNRDGEWGLSHDWFRVNVYGIVGFVEGSQVMWEPYNIKVPEPPHDFYNYDNTQMHNQTTIRRCKTVAITLHPLPGSNRGGDSGYIKNLH